MLRRRGETNALNFQNGEEHNGEGERKNNRGIYEMKRVQKKESELAGGKKKPGERQSEENRDF